MPTCCIKYCTNRTSGSKSKNVKFFRFPKDKIIRQQWLIASQRTETNIKVDTAMICSNHFDNDCFIMEWTKPRLKNVAAKEMQRLKKDAIPTKMLILEKKRRMPESKENMKRNKGSNIPLKTGVPTYTELVKCIEQEKHCLMHKEIVQHMEVETAENKKNTNIVDNTNNIEEVNNITEETVQHMEVETAENKKNTNIVDNTNNIEEVNNITEETVQHMEKNTNGKVDNQNFSMENAPIKTLLIYLRNVKKMPLP
ncbi:PREDICTED: THAP domain-containing protein 5-like [Cyphomyrmex costatus]|uniref:THAP domain-containing protein 5-like n=1 Tax=Cyphomyrmex costatus TaxID=456900 RepID=UPI0008523F11|nr:PREDICTED: THAP domain-containing protein 5-like [Cyphomyrmex costatus]